jgi:hypothetical protein
MPLQRKNKEYKFYKALYKHLIDTGQMFCFLTDGTIRDRNDCIKKLRKYEPLIDVVGV